MPTNIVISGVTGLSPYNVFICDTSAVNCTWISQFTSSQVPYTFELPFIYLGYSNFAVKVIDSNNCQVIKLNGPPLP
jgi:hypothetical protein